MKRRLKLTHLMPLILAGTTCISVMQAGDEVKLLAIGAEKLDEAAKDEKVGVTHVTVRSIHSDGDAVNFTTESTKSHKASEPNVTGRLFLSNEAELKLGTWLGVHVVPVSPLVAAQLGLAAGMGLAVEHVVSKSPADKAGVRKHDVLKRFGDQTLVNPEQLQVLVKSKEANDSVELTVVREGREKKLTATLGEMKPETISFDVKGIPLGEKFRWISDDATDGIKDVLVLRDGEDAKKGFHTRIVNLMNHNVTMADDTGRYVLITKDGKKHFSATGKNGKVLFDGFIGTDLEKSKLPPEVRYKLESLENTSSNELHLFKHESEGSGHREENVEIRIRSKKED